MAHRVLDDECELYCVEIRTDRWQELVAWYKNALGMQSLLRIDEDQYALLAAGGTRLAIVGRDPPGVRSPRWTLAFEVADLDLAEARLEGAGTEVGPRRLHPEGFTTIAATDPDGNRVRVFTWPK
ncbi:MAG TPA: VOC family protein [Pirellulales bacterium]|jgi:predicted enzyme related to lactoylglutathione lyase|nr:VOC family protein [Pirellulales bacterium]